MTERDAQIIELFKAGKTMPEIGKQFDLTRQGVRYILNNNGLSGKQRLQEQEPERQKKLLELLEENPRITLSKLEIALGCGRYLIKKDFKKLSIKREIDELPSLACREGWRNGRVELTKELLFHLYIEEKKTRKQIIEITKYGSSTISVYLRKYGIEKQKK
ncbi:MAG: hypothetical protein WA584_02075 [Pyrinomonadaceae bacterium]